MPIPSAAGFMGWSLIKVKSTHFPLFICASVFLIAVNSGLEAGFSSQQSFMMSSITGSVSSVAFGILGLYGSLVDGSFTLDITSGIFKRIENIQLPST